MGLLLWPNLAVLEDAPTTAKCLDEKNVLMEASVLMVGEFGMGDLTGLGWYMLGWVDIV